MERILNIKVDLEHPDEAKFAIDRAVETYKASKLRWSEEEIDKAHHLAMETMLDLCESGCSIMWGNELMDDKNVTVSVWLAPSNPDLLVDMNGICSVPKSMWNTWIGRCIVLYKAVKEEIPEFITRKLGGRL